MAIQNFISGGYYGKLGQTVGQRWKNKRTMRVYVIPKNPRTPAQQANRKTFADAVPWAHLGQSMNFRAPCWIDPSQIEWNLRMSYVRWAQKNNKTGLNLVPIHPQNFVAPYFISTITIDSKPSETEMVFTVTGNLPTTERKIALLFQLYDQGLEGDKVLIPGLLQYTDKWRIKIEVPEGIVIDDTSMCLACSMDDVNAATDMISSVEMPVQSSALVVEDFNATVKDITRIGQTFRIIFMQEYQAGANVFLGVQIKGLVNGAFKTKELSGFSVVNENGFFALEFTETESLQQNLIAFPSGSQIQIQNIDCVGTQKQLIGANVTQPMSSTDLVRLIQGNPANVEVGGGALMPGWATNYTGEQPLSGSYHAECRGNQEGIFSDYSTAFQKQVGNGYMQIYEENEYEQTFLNGGYIHFEEDVDFLIEGVTYRILAEQMNIVCAGNANIRGELTTIQHTIGNNQITLQASSHLSSPSAPAQTMNISPDAFVVYLRGNVSGTEESATPAAAQLIFTNDNKLQAVCSGNINQLSNSEPATITGFEFYFDAYPGVAGINNLYWEYYS